MSKFRTGLYRLGSLLGWLGAISKGSMAKRVGRVALWRGFGRFF